MLPSSDEQTGGGHLQMPTMRSDYNNNSRIQSQSLQSFKAAIDSAVAAHAFDASEDGAFVVADFGCSTGLNSSDAVSHAIEGLRRKYGGSERCRSVLVVLNDLARNPWNELFGFVHGDQRSFLRQHDGVFALASGLSFYEQVLPPSNLQLGLSSLAVHWCSRIPASISNNCVAMLGSDEERELFRQQSLQDWQSFLTARSRELVSGGVLAMNMVGAHEPVNGIFNESYEAAKALLARGVINQEELLGYNMRMYFLSLKDMTEAAPLQALGLEILHAEEVPPTRFVLYEDFLRHEDVGRFADEFANAWFAGCEPSFVAGLSAKRTDTDRRHILGEMRAEFLARVAKRPELFEYSSGFIHMVVRKKVK